MRKIYFGLAGLLSLMLAGCLPEQQEEVVPQEKALTMINLGAVAPKTLEEIRTFVQKQLCVPVRTVEIQKLAGAESFQTLETAALKVKTDADVTLIVLAEISGETEPLKVFENSGVALVNVLPLYVEDTQTFGRRVERMVMRAAAFSFGLPPTPDPHCVTRNYRTIEDLDKMGRNYSPPWQARYAKEAAARGLIAPKADVQALRKNPKAAGVAD